MVIWKLTTNEGTFYRRNKPTWSEMVEYIKNKRAEGKSLASIIFCWGPRHVS